MGKYKVIVDVPERPQGDDIVIPPVGVLKNGETVELELEKETAEFLGNAHGVTVESKGKEVKTSDG